MLTTKSIGETISLFERKGIDANTAKWIDSITFKFRFPTHFVASSNTDIVLPIAYIVSTSILSVSTENLNMIKIKIKSIKSKTFHKI